MSLLYHTGLENLPGEVTFLLEEIREKDVRISRELRYPSSSLLR